MSASGETLPENTLPASREDFEQQGIELLHHVSGVVGRLVAGPERKMYLALAPQLQERLGIEKPSEYVGAVFRDQEKRILDFYLLAGLPPDAVFQERVGHGLYLYGGLTSAETAAMMIRNYPLDGGENVIGLPTDMNNVGDRTTFAVLNLKAMQGKKVSTELKVQGLGNYSLKLGREWEGKNIAKKPMIVIPSAIAKLMGFAMERITRQPPELGKTVSGGDFCTLEYRGETIEVFAGAALDRFGMSPDLQSRFGFSPDESCGIEVIVGERKIIIKERPVTNVQRDIGRKLQ